MKKTIFELIRYFFVGLAATFVDYGAYIFLTRFLLFHVLYANPLAYAVGSVVSFVGQRTITFRSRERYVWHQYLRFIAVNLVGLGLSQLVIIIGLKIGVHDLIAKAATIVVAGAFNYLGNRFWTFRGKQVSV